MHLELGRRADYAIRAVMDLARHDRCCAGRRKAREIVDEMGIPPSYVGQILADLVHAGFIDSAAGPDGGYALVRDPAETTLLDVIVAVDGEIESTECVLRGGPCRWDGVCAVHVPWSRAQAALRTELGRTTFADIADIDRGLEAGTYVVPEEFRPMPPHVRPAADGAS